MTQHSKKLVAALGRVLGTTVMIGAGVLFTQNAVQAGGPPLLTPAGLETCDGKAWSGLELGKTAGGEIRRLFRCGRGDLDSSVDLLQPRDSPVRIVALFASHKKEAPVLALCLHYKNVGPDLDALKKSMAPVERYETGRLEDWRVTTFPGHGIAAFTITRGGITATPLVVLTSDAAIDDALKSLNSTYTPVEVRNDPNANKPRVMDFGTATADFALDRPFEVKTEERDNLERDMREATAGGTMRYVQGAAGSYTVRVGLQYDAKRGGTLTVSSAISGNGPYGPISVTSEKSDTIKAAGGTGLDPSWSYTVLLLETRLDVEKQFRDSMRHQGPPPIAEVTAMRWAALIEALRRQAASPA